MRVAKEAFAHKMGEAQADLVAKEDAAFQLESAASALRARLSTLEVAFIQRDEEAALKLLRKVGLEDKAQELRAQCDAFTVHNMNSLYH